MNRFQFVVGACVATALSLACSSDPDPTAFGDPAANGGLVGSSGGTNASGGLNSGGTTGVTTDFTACADSKARSDLLPLTLFFIIDRSGSMCEYDPANRNNRDCSKPASKWAQANAGLKSFFQSPNSKNISASFVTFAAANSKACDASNFNKSEAPLTALPDTGNVLAGKLSLIKPDGATPTQAALQGGVEYAKTLKPTGANAGSLAVVFVTDGLPEGCPDAGNISLAAQVCATAKADGVPVYIIGVGNALQNLDALASAAGTNGSKAFQINNADPTKVGADLLTAFEAIRGAQLGCSLTLPSPPDGKTLDPHKVNVELTKADSSKVAVPYSQDCTNAAGWKYDNATTPTHIELCATSCGNIKAASGSSINIVFGCSTLTTVK